MLTLAVAVAFPKLLKPATGQCDRVVRQHYILVGKILSYMKANFNGHRKTWGNSSKGVVCFMETILVAVLLFFFLNNRAFFPQERRNSIYI